MNIFQMKMFEKITLFLFIIYSFIELLNKQSAKNAEWY